jgi:hypothetical protein
MREQSLARPHPTAAHDACAHTSDRPPTCHAPLAQLHLSASTAAHVRGQGNVPLLGACVLNIRRAAPSCHPSPPQQLARRAARLAFSIPTLGALACVWQGASRSMHAGREAALRLSPRSLSPNPSRSPRGSRGPPDAPAAFHPASLPPGDARPRGPWSPRRTSGLHLRPQTSLIVAGQLTVPLPWDGSTIVKPRQRSPCERAAAR